MRISSIVANNVLPIRKFEETDLTDLIVIAGPNGVGKTRLFQAMIAGFQSPSPNNPVRFVIESTSAAEKMAWQSSFIDTTKVEDATKLAATLQQSRRRSKFESSVMNFESDRSIQQIAPYQFSWDFQDPPQRSPKTGQ